MSNTIRYDSLLVRHLARELHVALGDVAVTAVHFQRASQRVVIALLERALVWDVRTGAAHWETDLKIDDAGIPLPRHATIAAVDAPPDERILSIALRGGKRQNAVRTLLIELQANAGNAVALDEEGRVLKSLFPRSGSRAQMRGQAFNAPDPQQRLGADSPLTEAEWLELLGPVPPGERVSQVSARVAYTSALNALALLPDPADLDESFARYHELMTSETQAVVLPDGQPYCHRLWQAGVAHHPSLLAAIESANTAQRTSASAIERLERNAAREQKKLEKLQKELESAAVDAERLRTQAGLLLASAALVKRGADSIELTNFDGAPIRLTLNPARTAIQNAEDWYDEARKRDRAGERLPAMIDETKRALEQAERKLERARAGELPAPPDDAVKAVARPVQRGPRLPYKQFRTSGGLEVRVGRSSKDNDELTLRHSAPNDIWMHARAVGGAHVVLRWSDPNGNPPKQDLAEAATLAALNSRARHAGTVPIDWTRKKYVRKRRGAPAGQVMLEQSKTIFVKPSPELEDKLRWTD